MFGAGAEEIKPPPKIGSEEWARDQHADYDFPKSHSVENVQYKRFGEGDIGTIDVKIFVVNIVEQGKTIGHYLYTNFLTSTESFDKWETALVFA